MPMERTIHLLDEDTVNKIAAGEVIERPFNVAKELIENSIDAGAGAITLEVAKGGSALIRVTDNGCGIAPEDVAYAFRRHATSKLGSVRDLDTLSTLGFRGEALSSIASVAQVEMITKKRGALSGIRAVTLDGPVNPGDDIPMELTEIGAPDGTSIIVRNLFYNVPVRKKFLKSAVTETGYITELVEHLALSHPEISFHYRADGKERLHTTGNGNIREIIYRIYGRDIADRLIAVNAEQDGMKLAGYIGRPETSRGSRSFETFFVNGRLLYSDVLSHSLETGYRTDLMQHQFPFAVLYLEMPPHLFDVNVHPAKREVRFAEADKVYSFIDESVRRALGGRELIPGMELTTAKERREEDEKEREKLYSDRTEPFESGRAEHAADPAPAPGPEPVPVPPVPGSPNAESVTAAEGKPEGDGDMGFLFEDLRTPENPADSSPPGAYEVRQMELNTASLALGAQGMLLNESTPADRIFTDAMIAGARIIGQVFLTYWLVEIADSLLLIDQHAAHEKVNFERFYRRLLRRFEEPVPSQMLLPPQVITMTGQEESCYLRYKDTFAVMGYEIEPFGDRRVYTVRAVPLELFGEEPGRLFTDTLDELMNERITGTPSDILYRVATMACKASVKGNQRISAKEAEALIKEMLTLDNPYHCPHGRPTMIRLTKREVEKRFGRIV